MGALGVAMCCGERGCQRMGCQGGRRQAAASGLLRLTS